MTVVAIAAESALVGRAGSDPPGASGFTLQAVEEHAVPVLRITSGSGSLDFYARLGFEIAWEHRFAAGLPLFASVLRGNWHVFLSEHDEDAAPKGLAYFYADDVDAVHEAWRSLGVVLEPPQDRPWGMRELQVVDPDGNRLRVGSLAAVTD